MDAIAAARAERGELAELLDDLTEEQWDQPSLCAGWRIRDVVAHMISYDDLTPPQLIARLVGGRISALRGGPDANQIGVDRAAGLTTAELLEWFRAHLDPRGLTRGLGGGIGLTDGMIHQQDIRRPLGRPRSIPADRVRFALDFARRAPTLPARRRIRGVRLEATDLDWARGRGPVVRGAGEALLMLIAGRFDGPYGVRSELSGDGIETVGAR